MRRPRALRVILWTQFFWLMCFPLLLCSLGAHALPLPDEALALAAEGKHEEAVAHFERVKRENPEAIQSIHGHKIAVVYATIGDRARHEAHCRWLMDRYKDAELPTDAERSVKGYLLFPSADEPALLEDALARTRLATDFAESRGEGDLLAWFEGSRGMAEYRVGNYAEAVKWLEKAARDKSLYIGSLALPFQAMSEHALGNHGRARELLEASREAAARLPKPGTEEYLKEWTDTLTTQHALREAEQVLGEDRGASRLQVSENGRYLLHADGAPFFYLGDTAWELFHRLNREEADLYLRNRAEKGFTVIQAVVIGELSGLTQGNAYGDKPFHDMDAARPNEAYFEHVDWIVNKAAELGLYIGMLPTWGRWLGGADEGRDHNNFFNGDNARAYGAFLGARYRDRPIIWILGGDRLADKTAGVWEEMARGIRGEVGPAQLMTYHPRGGRSSSVWFHGSDWLDFNMSQSGHSAESANYVLVERDYALDPPKPTLDGEPAYEYPPDAMPDHRPVGALQVRRNAWWAVFAGACGHTYGTHPIWQMYDEGRKPLWDVVTPWHQALDLPGASQLIHLKRLMLSRPYATRIPDQDLNAGEARGGIRRVQLTRDGTPGQNDATYLLAYVPDHQRVTLETGRIAGKTLRGWWLNPRTGETTALGAMDNQEHLEFEPPTQAPGEDWVLVLDDAERGYGVPGV